jgi:hypothetical protein
MKENRETLVLGRGTITLQEALHEAKVFTE